MRSKRDTCAGGSVCVQKFISMGFSVKAYKKKGGIGNRDKNFIIEWNDGDTSQKVSTIEMCWCAEGEVVGKDLLSWLSEMATES